jgi:KaiC/GvpD/RAD55 family RecA-like ATPase
VTGTLQANSVSTTRRDFFISYTRADEAWAVWIAWQLEQEGYTVVVQPWDFRPGSDFGLEMQRAVTSTERTLVVVSPAYQQATFPQSEWVVAFGRDPAGDRGTLVPVRVADFSPEGIFLTRTYIDLVGLDAGAARDALLNGVKRSRAKPLAEPGFPGDRQADHPAFPGDEQGAAADQGDEPLSLGFRDLDDLTGGFETGELLVLAGRPGIGRSTFALEVALHVAIEQKRTVAIFSPEASWRRVYQRFVGRRAEVAPRRLRTGELGDPEWDRIIEAAGELADSAIYMDFSVSLTVDDVKRRCGTLPTPCDLVVIDSLSLMTVDRATVGYQLKALARELDVAVLIVAVVSNAVDQRMDHRPMLGDLRAGETLEEAADLILFLHRADFFDPNSDRRGLAEIIVAKHRHGPRGIVYLRWDQDQAKFADLVLYTGEH